MFLSGSKTLLDQTPSLKKRHLDGDRPARTRARKRLAASPTCMATRWRFLQYTSGSTGTPKGVMLNHANLMHNSALIAYAFEHTRSVHGVFWLPSYHDMGLIGGILQPLYIGQWNVLMSPMSFLQKPFRWLQAISQYRATISGGPNFAYDLCVRKITPEQREKLDLSSWRLAFNGAEPVREETIDSFAKAFEPCGFRREAFYPCYGMAEATLIVSGGFKTAPPVIRSFRRAGAGDRTRWSTRWPRKKGRGARRLRRHAAWTSEIVIANPDTLTRCAADEVGEIWVAGPSVAQGYWKRPEETDAYVPRPSGRRRRSVPAHRRSGLHARWRAVRHRPAERPDHRPRPELLSAGHRADGRAQPSVPA